MVFDHETGGDVVVHDLEAPTPAPVVAVHNIPAGIAVDGSGRPASLSNSAPDPQVSSTNTTAFPEGPEGF